MNDENGGGLLNIRNIIVAVFLLVALGVLAATFIQTATDLNDEADADMARVEVFCHIGSEKDDLMANPQVREILLERYNVDVTTNNMGSIDQARLTTAQLQDVDCMWPSNTSALDIFNENHPDLGEGSSIIFNSPIVLYTWQPIVDGLEAGGLITRTAEDYYVIDSADLVAQLTAEPRPTWEDLGVNDLFGGINVVTSDPTRSNSGNMFYGLLLNMLNGDVATVSDLDTHFDTIQAYYQRQGLQQGSSGTLFDNFIVQGMGATPIMANYESLIVEFSIANRDQLDAISDILRVVYPRPTVWSSHPIIALTPEGRRLMDALADPDIQQIAWEQHGFRSGLAGITNDPSVLNVAGIPAQVTSVINLPQAQAMIEMVNRLEGAS